MKCADCGKELIKVGELTKNEKDNYALIATKESVSLQYLKTDTINGMNFTEGQVYEYFRAAFEGRCDAEFLKFIFFRDLRARLNIDKNKDIWIEEFDGDTCEVYVHPDD